MGNPPKQRTYKESYDHFLPVAMQLAEAEVQACRADVPVALANIKLGVKAVCGDAAAVARIAAHLPKIATEDLLGLPDLGRALYFISGKVVSRAVSVGEIDKALKEISSPREQMLSQAEILAQRGHLDPDRVAKIRANSGKFDRAKDGVDLVELYAEKAKELKGLHPFTQEEFDKLGATSEWLLDNLTPDGARKETKKRTALEDERDRLWTLVLKRHPALRIVGYYFHGDDFEAYTPKLLSRVAQAVLDEEAPASPASPTPKEP
jgi:hypothetical protein